MQILQIPVIGEGLLAIGHDLVGVGDQDRQTFGIPLLLGHQGQDLQHADQHRRGPGPVLADHVKADVHQARIVADRPQHHHPAVPDRHA